MGGGFDPTPPQPEMGQIVGPPDFVGIGAQKAGTTWWFDAICAHPASSLVTTSTRSATSSAAMPSALSARRVLALPRLVPTTARQPDG